LIGDFYIINILPREASGDVVANEKSHEAQTGMGGVAHQADRTTRACLALERRLVSVFLWMAFFSSKKERPIFPIIF
jgi:hypothetical protein